MSKIKKSNMASFMTMAVNTLEQEKVKRKKLQSSKDKKHNIKHIVTH